MDYITAYEITASFERDGQVQDASQAEVLVDAFGKIFFEEVAAEAFAEELQEDLDSTDLDPTTEYSVREVSVEVEIDLADADPDGPSDEYSHYVCLDVTLGCGNKAQEFRIGCMVGAQESMHGTIEAAGCWVRPHCTAWWTDQGDYQDLPSGTVEQIESLLIRKSWTLFCAAEEVSAGAG